MTEQPEGAHHSRIAGVFRSMWRNWAISLGSLALLLGCALIINARYLPWIALAEAYALTAAIKSGRWLLGNCSYVPRLAVRVLVFSALVMFAILVAFTDWLVPKRWVLEIVTEEIPFVTCLVVFPIMALMCILALTGIVGRTHCERCRQNTGYYSGDNVIGTLYYREARYQTGILLMLAVCLGGVEYWYFFTQFLNSNMNAPDQFFFVIMPVAVYLLSLLVMWTRYRAMFELFTSVDEMKTDRANRTTVRFLVVCGDDLLLAERDKLWDTPYEKVIGYREKITDEVAAGILGELSGLDAEAFELRYCFVNEGLADGSNVMHYAAFVKEDKREQLVESNRNWFTAYMLDVILQGGLAARPLAQELFRIYHITMAWKTYFADGRRRYPIKNYRPTFRLGDLKRWEVDYDDAAWFAVKYNNEDRPFYRLRHLWQRMTDVFRSKNEHTADEKHGA